jgi:thiamine pyrophosphokinase
MRAVSVAGGPGWLRASDWILGADGGAAQARAWGLTPDLVVGDLDSLPAEDQAALEDAGIAFVVHPRAKDETDLELALTEAVERGFEEIVVVQALGGRLDHTLANVLLLALPALAGRRVRIVDGGQEAALVRPGEALILEGQHGDLVSLLPLGGDAHGVTAKGLAWALEEATLRFGFSRGVSNEMTGARAQVSVEDGMLLVVHGPTEEKQE